MFKVFIAIHIAGMAYGYRQNVLDFCSTVINGYRTDVGCECMGKTGKSGPPGPKGDKGDEFDPSELMSQLEVLKSKFERMERNPDITFQYCLMGVKSGAIPDSSMSSSTDYNARHLPKYGRLDRTLYAGAWCPLRTTIGQWIQVDLGSPHLIKATVTQGRDSPNGSSDWATTYKVACGVTDTNLSIITEGGKHKIFQGNSDKTTKVIGWFPEPVTCRYVRLYPQTWHTFMCLRMDVVKANCP